MRVSYADFAAYQVSIKSDMIPEKEKKMSLNWRCVPVKMNNPSFYGKERTTTCRNHLVLHFFLLYPIATPAERKWLLIPFNVTIFHSEHFFLIRWGNIPLPLQKNWDQRHARASDINFYVSRLNLVELAEKCNYHSGFVEAVAAITTWELKHTLQQL